MFKGSCCFFVIGCTMALVGAAVIAGENGHRSWLSDPKLTPGAFAESRTAICMRGDDRTPARVAHKAGTLARYRIAPADAARYEDYDLIPV